MNSLHLLKRHPFSVRAHFRHCLVLTYALPEHKLAPLLPPGLTLDTHNGYGFVAIACVQTEGLRPVGLPKMLGQSFFLVGYRVFARYHTRSGKNLRGLRILRSYADKPLMVRMGNLLTHYNYRLAQVELANGQNRLEISVRTPERKAELRVKAELGEGPRELPVGSVFKSEKEALRFAGPLPFTFDYEPQTHSIIRIQSVRKNWSPRLVKAEVIENRFFEQRCFEGANPIFSSAFYVGDIPYLWKKGVREPLSEAAPSALKNNFALLCDFAPLRSRPVGTDFSQSAQRPEKPQRLGGLDGN